MGRSKPDSQARSRRHLVALVISVGAVAAALLLLFGRGAFLAPGQSDHVLTRLRNRLGLGPVLAAEQLLAKRPSDPQARLQLADACERSGDPVGAALALYRVLSLPELDTGVR